MSTQLVSHPEHPWIQIHSGDAATVRAVPGDDAPQCAFVFHINDNATIHVPPRPVLGRNPSLGARMAYAAMVRDRRDAIERCRKFGLRAMTEL